MESSLSPRDIQTRIRAGESLEDVARVAGIPLDRVERFAAPCWPNGSTSPPMAMSASVRRRGETSGHRSLRITVTERLLSRGVDIDTIAWDSYRLEDGRWAVTADYRSGEAARHASFTYDLRGRFSVAANDEARWLLGEHSSAKGPQPGRRRPASRPADARTTPSRRWTSATSWPWSGPPRRRAERGRRADPAGARSRAGAAAAAEPVGGPAARTLGGDGVQRGLAAGLPRTRATRARCRDRPGAAGWEPAIVVNYPVEPSQHDGQRAGARRAGPDRPTAEVPLSDEPPPEIESPTVPAACRRRARTARHRRARPAGSRPSSLADRMDEAEEFEDESVARAAADRPRPAKRKRATRAQLGRDHVRRTQALVAAAAASGYGSDPAATGRSGSVIQSLHEPG